MFRSLNSRRPSSPRSDAGFTLIEVLVSILVLAIGIGAALTVFAQADNTESVASRNDVASQAARQVIDELRTRDYKSLAVSDPAGIGTVNGKPKLGDAPGNSAMSAVAKTQLQTMFARDRVVAPEGTTLPGLQVGRAGETNLAEPLVAPDDKRQGNGKAISSYRVMSVTDGEGHDVRVHVLTRVTWRDVQCPILDLTNPLGQAKDLLAGLSNLLKPSPGGNGYSLYDLLLGSKGALTSLLSSKDQLVQKLLSSISSTSPSSTVLSTLLANVTNSAISPVLAFVGETLSKVTGTVFTPVAALVDPIGQLLASVVAPLANSLDPILNALTGPLTKLTDLCDLNLVDDGSGNGLIAPLQAALPGLAKLSTSLAGLQHTLATKNFVGDLTDAASNVLAASNVSAGLPAPPSCPVLNLVDPCFTTWAAGNLVTTLVRGVTSIVQDTVGPLLETVTATLTSLPSTVNAVITTAGNLPQLVSSAGSLLSGANSAILNGYKNTKRITVAAWPELNGRLLGSRPQYFSAIVTNPKASLLSADQAG